MPAAQPSALVPSSEYRVHFWTAEKRQQRVGRSLVRYGHNAIGQLRSSCFISGRSSVSAPQTSSPTAVFSTISLNSFYHEIDCDRRPAL